MNKRNKLLITVTVAGGSVALAVRAVRRQHAEEGLQQKKHRHSEKNSLVNSSSTPQRTNFSKGNNHRTAMSINKSNKFGTMTVVGNRRPPMGTIYVKGRL